MAKESSRIPRIDGSTSRIPLPGSLRSSKTLVSRLAKPGHSQLHQQREKITTSIDSAQFIQRSLSGDGLRKAMQNPVKTIIKTTSPSSCDSKQTMKKSPSLECHKMIVDETIDLVDFDDGFGSNKNLVAHNSPQCSETITINTNGNVTYEVNKSVDNNTFDVNESQHQALAGNSTKADAADFIDNQQELNRFGVHAPQSDQNITKLLCLSNDSIIDLSPIAREKIFNSTMTKNLLLDLSPNGQMPRFDQPLRKPESVTNLLCLPSNRSSDNCDETVVTSNQLAAEAMQVDNDDDRNNIFRYDCRHLKKSDKCLSNEQLQKNVEKMGLDMPRAKQRFSLGLDLTECIADCSIELCDVSSSSSQPVKSPSGHIQKQNSFEMDESLGILTPDQMKEFLDSVTTTNTNMDLPHCQNDHKKLKLTHHQCRVDQTPSPEELPLDTVAVKTDFSDAIMEPTHTQTIFNEMSHSEMDTKTEMTKSTASKVSASIITSITSITSSLDIGYQGDGEEMDSRPASRGADQSPTNCPKLKILNNNNNNVHCPVIPIHRGRIRLPEPMTDSDFYTESDDGSGGGRGGERRCAQVIDGQLYGPMLQVGEKVYIHEHPHTDSAMESSGVFTDIDNRCDEDLMHRLNENNHNDSDMSPDTSTDTIGTTCSQAKPENATAMSKSLQNSPNNSSQSSAANSLDVVIISDVSFASGKSVSTDLTIDKIASSSLNNSLNVNTNTARYDVSISNTSTKVGSGKKYSTSRKTLKNETNLHLKKHDLSNRDSESCNAGKVQKFSKIKSNSRDSVDKAAKICGDDVIMIDNDNQENRRPPIHAARKIPNNKWDAVMNKIAENKVVPKKNFYDVKSKVSCGVTKQRLNSLSKTSSTDDNCKSSNLSSRHRTIQQSTSKRNRTHSKDSQQSSASDLSLVSGSPLQKKLTPNTRSVKKRDARTINSTPSDIGQPVAKLNGSARTKSTILTHKRISPNTTPPVEKLNNSPSSKKFAARKLISEPINANKILFKDPNHALDEKSPKKELSTLSSSPKSQQNGQKSETSSNSSTPSQQNLHLPPGSPLTRGGTIVIDRESPTHLCKLSKSPPNETNNNNNNNKKTNNHNNSSTTNRAKNLGGSKSTNSSTKISSNCSQLRDLKGRTSAVSSAQQRQQSPLKSQLRAKDNQQALELHNSIVEELNTNLSFANKGVEALGVLVQYLVYNLDAFACPTVKQKLQRTTRDLVETQTCCNDARSMCQALETQLAEKEAYFSGREREQQEFNRTELERAENLLIDLKTTTNDRITFLETELIRKEEQKTDELMQCKTENDAKLLAMKLEIEAAQEREAQLLERISSLSCTENELREKVHSSELDYSERLQMAAMRERELNDMLCVLRKQVEETKVKSEKSEVRERELTEKLNLTQDEITVLRQSRSTPERSNGGAVVNVSRAQILQDEVESLRCVLELKQSEISDLRKQNQELSKSSDELTQALVKISALESRVEDVQVQLSAKLEEEKDLIQKQKQLQESYSQEVKNRNRLSLHNEELQWRLKQNSEKFSIALSELSKSYQDSSGLMNFSTKSAHNQDLDSSIMNKSNCSDKSVDCFMMEDISPPTSPIIKGVVEKSDSVSWVLEMDESPEALASRVVRRAGSFRSSAVEKLHIPSPVLKRHKSQTSNLPDTKDGIQLSPSAVSMQRQSSEPAHCRPGETTPRSRSKSVSVKVEPLKELVRSNSNSGQSVKKTLRSTIDIPVSWDGASPMYSSSPLSNKAGVKHSDDTCPSPCNQLEDNCEILRMQMQRTASLDSNGQDGPSPSQGSSTVIDFHRDKTPKFTKSRENRGLITCDTKALTSAATFDRRCKNQIDNIMCRSLPTMQSKGTTSEMKKPRRPKFAAGEALVSGSNSEDESLSSDDYQLSSESSSSCTSNSSRRQLSIEDVLLHKIVTSLNGCGDGDDGDQRAATSDELLIDECRTETPMDVSWSEDGEPPSESIV